MSKILITGSAGFIGYHLANKLAAEGHEVIGLDNLNNYYDVKLKLDRLESAGIESRHIAYNEPVVSTKYPNYTFIQLGIEDAANLERLFGRYKFEKVCHLAAQAGVRYSIKHPEAYIQANIVGFFNVLESSRHHGVQHLVFASSSSVYGDNLPTPFQENAPTDSPISFYAATKKSNELMAHTYSHLFNLPCTGLRFFTVYGPWGRPDMAYSLFTKAMLEGQPIKVFNEGKLSRDFTYVDDIVEGVRLVLGGLPLTPKGEPRKQQTGVTATPQHHNTTTPQHHNTPLTSRSESGTGPKGEPSKQQPGVTTTTPQPHNTTTPKPHNTTTPQHQSSPPFQIYNIGNAKPTPLMEFIHAIEDELGIEAKKEFLPMQPGDVETTFADVSALMNDFGYQPKTSVQEGIRRFVKWYLLYNQAGLTVFQ